MSRDELGRRAGLDIDGNLVTVNLMLVVAIDKLNVVGPRHLRYTTVTVK